ncbi:3-phosphoshikimate 1-carboxyvinyltransferase [Bacillus cereus]|uniref:3-phosphoshikimate 1-carboxyvinyltransferase n=1 Tax=Bacillus cereus TaxID=1396 RepID=UPI00065A529D|nr:3-phosphoshikimate 1-carboxyvinyltransferase [Bacillus cereus]KLA35438.1 5-Enolpyruvylshikimate-3-phosphate synthase [Bacillus cereus]PED02706.1 3-phosphoshikimate 1-carboxyvinyltransferase [Bacillus cereus]PED87762.1 3-phosphoshikimate 1-carboxyvinyltransferase [Bacillus cereus]PEQ80803.1 3-phosphoshikimate 1-carboxyvinyltransferase [Bacillus cereus]PER61130.1 3-phosphoshikimate 1-carboxyvinyltransferase [Bacillus cereus]
MELKIQQKTSELTLPKKFDVKIRTKIPNKSIVFDTISGDKSISQRALILNALGYGKARISNILKSDDIYSCISALKKLGVSIQWENNDVLVQGVGLTGLRPAKHELNMGNSATATRLIMSLVAGSPFRTKFTGNELLSKRPMGWVVNNFREMGARITFLGEEGCLPLVVEGKYPLLPINVKGTVASAQEKSSLLVAGLFANGTTTYEQICQSRDHTERLLQALGIPIHSNGNITKIDGTNTFTSRDIVVPGDISSASFLITAGILQRNMGLKKIRLNQVGINKTRIGFLDAIQKMGVTIDYKDKILSLNEPVANVIYKTEHELIGTEVKGTEFVQSLIDEIPLLAAVATQAKGETVIRDCRELKDKDTNRIETTANIIRAFGGEVSTSDTVIIIHGESNLHSAKINSFGDHRIAMMALVLGSSLQEYSYIENCECISVSYPMFLKDISNFAEIEIISREDR